MRNKRELKLGENMEVLCPRCNAVCRKLYWLYPSRYNIERVVFAGWFGCTDCGFYIYDRDNDEHLEPHSSNRSAKK